MLWYRVFSANEGYSISTDSIEKKKKPIAVLVIDKNFYDKKECKSPILLPHLVLHVFFFKNINGIYMWTLYLKCYNRIDFQIAQRMVVWCRLWCVKLIFFVIIEFDFKFCWFFNLPVYNLCIRECMSVSWCLREEEKTKLYACRL